VKITRRQLIRLIKEELTRESWWPWSKKEEDIFDEESEIVAEYERPIGKYFEWKALTPGSDHWNAKMVTPSHGISHIGKKWPDGLRLSIVAHPYRDNSYLATVNPWNNWREQLLTGNGGNGREFYNFDHAERYLHYLLNTGGSYRQFEEARFGSIEDDKDWKKFWGSVPPPRRRQRW